MFATIKARLAHPPQEDWTGRYFEFAVIGYAEPRDCVEREDPEYLPHGLYADWYYINAAGFAQKYDPAKPPSRFPSSARLIVAPSCTEPIYKGRV